MARFNEIRVGVFPNIVNIFSRKMGLTTFGLFFLVLASIDKRENVSCIGYSRRYYGNKKSEMYGLFDCILLLKNYRVFYYTCYENI